MGKILPGIIVAFENPKGGVGKSTLTAIFAGYLHIVGKEKGLTVGVIDVDDTQNSLGKMRYRNIRNEEVKEETDEYEIMSISSAQVLSQINYLRKAFDIILIDFPGNLKQDGIVQLLHRVDVIIIPFEANEMVIADTIDFFKNIYKPIIKTRLDNGFKTSVKGVINKVVPNLKEYKQLIEFKNSLPFELLENNIKDSKVEYARYITTLKDKYHTNAEPFCEEVLSLIFKHIQS